MVVLGTVYSPYPEAWFFHGLECTGVIGGGCSNHLDNDTCLSSVVGGQDNHIEKSCYSFIGGGKDNCIKETTIANQYNTIVGGLGHVTRDTCNPDVAPFYSFIGGGQENTSSACYTFIGAGCKNFARANASIVVGGIQNTASTTAVCSFMGGGCGNCISGISSIIVGGIVII